MPSGEEDSMDSYSNISSRQLLFLADTHFRNPRLEAEAERRRRFIGFLETVPDGAALFLLGDIFDFYFEYRSVVLKRYFDILYALRRSVERGVEVHFLGGNHDFWVGDFLSEEIGLTLHGGDDILIDSQGRKICCSHGDLVLPNDGSYRRIRAIIRNRHVINAARLLHPDLMSAIATRISSGSKNRKRGALADMANHLCDIAPGEFFSKGNDVFIIGHVHYPLHRVYDDRDFMIVGDWIESYTYGKLEGGRLSLEKV